jgi:hypothetical protein
MLEIVLIFLFWCIFALYLDKIKIAMIKVSDTASKKIIDDAR